MIIKLLKKLTMFASLSLVWISISQPLRADDAQATVEPLWKKAAADYRQRSRYPENSRLIPESSTIVDPLMQERTPTRKRSTGPRGGTYLQLMGFKPMLEVWPAQMSFEAGESPVIFASLINRGAPMSVGSMGTSIVINAEIIDDNQKLMGQVVFNDRGEGPDITADDGVFSAEADFMDDFRPELAKRFLVRITASIADSNPGFATTGFLISNPWGKLTGKFKDRVENGNLIISARVNIAKAGKFHLSGSISRRNRPIGTAQNSIELPVGSHWIDLSFYGLMFHERQVRGRVTLSALTLTTTSGMPNAMTEVVTNVYRTKPIRLVRMKREPYNDPAMSNMATELERVDADRRQGLETQ